MNIKTLLNNVQILEIQGNMDIDISHISFDSRNVIDHTLFSATNGEQVNGHNFVSQAISSGALAIVYDEDIETPDSSVVYVRVKNSSDALGQIASNYYESPSAKLNLIGVTGTNGKTTIATLLYNLYKSFGYKVGLISTIQNIIDGKILASTHTTPDALKLNELLSEMIQSGCEYCFMEVSSHSITQNRISGLFFRGGIFTNITHEHLDYHKTFNDYIKAKKKFFDQLPASAFALTNIDDPNGKVMLQNTKAHQYSYALKHFADYKAKIIENQFDGMLMNINGFDSWFRLVGDFNAYNLLAIYASAIILGNEQAKTLKEMSTLFPAEGRFEVITSLSGLKIVVDYAHTPDALKNVLQTIRSLCKRNEKIISVIGAGGNRDVSKRPLMTATTLQYSDVMILTSDNPRYEDPELIISEMCTGIVKSDEKNVLKITNRKEAIKTACYLAKSGDIVLIAGKGHEKYQEIQGVKYPFDDKQVVCDILETI
ncbi:MAG: UDP-N-acetylmuramoyl-L-alanyl-D-glutamate--2,6-diaminopimelate ligase [Bacteroidota bacterium]